MRRAGPGTVAAVLVSLALAQANPLVEPRAGTWRTWVLPSGQALRLPPPPDPRATAVELAEPRALAGRRDAAALARIRPPWETAEKGV